ncbi:MAG TPA: NAD(P)/FAD-dependent oxidoreductase [Gemmataceae bacterium]|jgi:2-polyprenyl-6-methoxyphenol hydroxylase-like FAD-dependent oxidoreductase
MAIDFLIVGGGIGGAVLANLLGRRGKRVLILEKGRTTLPQNRPEILWPATVEVLRTLIPKSLEQRWMVPIRGGVLTYRGKQLLRFGPELFDSAGVQPYSTANTRELLLQQAPCEYQRGVEVIQLLREQGRVVGVRARDTASGAEREILAAWTVGDDGAHSLVRCSCGLPMNFVRFPVEALGFSFNWPQGLPADTVRIWLNRNRLQTPVLGMLPLPEGRGAGLIPIWRETFQNPGRLQMALHAISAQDPLLNELIGRRKYPQDFTQFQIAWGRTPRFGVAGALLMGDAAHPVTPAGGQGANASIADALVIAEVALERPNELLTEYERRRRPATLRSLSLSRGASRLFSLPRPVLNLGLMLLPWAAGWLNRRPQTFGRFLRIAAGAFREGPVAGAAN